MSEDDRNKAIQKIIDDLIKKEKEEAEAQQREEYLAPTTRASVQQRQLGQTKYDDSLWGQIMVLL